MRDRHPFHTHTLPVRRGLLAACAGLALLVPASAHPAAERTDPYPLTKGVRNHLYGSGLLAVCGLTIDGVQAPILAQSDTEIATQVPAGVAIGPRVVDVCFETAPCGGPASCLTAHLGAEEFEYELPPVVGIGPTPDCARQVEVSGNLAVVLYGSGGSPAAGLAVFDVSNPALPVALDTLDLDAPLAFARAGAFVHVATETALVIVDLTDPADLVVASTRALPDETTRGIVARDGIVYLTVAGSIEVIDVSDPAVPLVVRTLAPSALLGYEARRLRLVAGERLLVITRVPCGVICLGPPLLLDVSRPERPRLITREPDLTLLDATATCSTLYGIPVNDVASLDCADLGCVVNTSPLFVVGDVTDPRGIELVAWLASDHAGSANAQAVTPELLFSVGSSFGRGKLLVSDVSDPAAPRLVTARTLPDGLSQGVVVDGGYAYVANCSTGLAVVDVSALPGVLPPAPPLGPCSPRSASSAAAPLR